MLIYIRISRSGEMADALDSKSSEGDLVRVQVPPSAPRPTEFEHRKNKLHFYQWCRGLCRRKTKAKGQRVKRCPFAIPTRRNPPKRD